MGDSTPFNSSRLYFGIHTTSSSSENPWERRHPCLLQSASAGSRQAGMPALPGGFSSSHRVATRQEVFPGISTETDRTMMTPPPLLSIGIHFRSFEQSCLFAQILTVYRIRVHQVAIVSHFCARQTKSVLNRRSDRPRDQFQTGASSRSAETEG